MNVWITSFKESLLILSVHGRAEVDQVHRSADRLVCVGFGVVDYSHELDTLYDVLIAITQMMAPFTPYLTEFLVQRLRQLNEESSKEYLDDIKCVVNFILDELNIRNISLSPDKKKYGVNCVPNRTTKSSLKLGFFTVLDHRIELNELRSIYQFDEQQGGGQNYEAHSYNDVLFQLDLPPNDELMKEGVAREIINRTQKLILAFCGESTLREIAFDMVRMVVEMNLMVVMIGHDSLECHLAPIPLRPMKKKTSRSRFCRISHRRHNIRLLIWKASRRRFQKGINGKRFRAWIRNSPDIHFLKLDDEFSNDCKELSFLIDQT
ncbi:hypothetical protein pipiens_010341 [Culex pipiens pipiens]|uniref:Uncharacterized protein n=1 Tax=Culex pipiens pipiens TaxID=38569 RepID=A0ABD1DAM1_CULPP